jgi:hypothetical protein
MAKTINGINFTNLSKIGIGSSFGNIKKDGITTESDLQDYIDNNIEYRNIQSVLIDWNGADWDSVPASSSPSTINTTSDLLKTIKYAANGERFGK